MTSGVVVFQSPKKKGVLTQVHTNNERTQPAQTFYPSSGMLQQDSLVEYSESKMYLRNIEAIKYV